MADLSLWDFLFGRDALKEAAGTKPKYKNNSDAGVDVAKEAERVSQGKRQSKPPASTPAPAPKPSRDPRDAAKDPRRYRSRVEVDPFLKGFTDSAVESLDPRGLIDLAQAAYVDPTGTARAVGTGLYDSAKRLVSEVPTAEGVGGLLGAMAIPTPKLGKAGKLAKAAKAAKAVDAVESAAQAAKPRAIPALRKGLDEATKTYSDYFDKYAANLTQERTPGEGIGHLEGLLGASEAERAAYSDAVDRIYSPEGRSPSLDEAGLLQRPMVRATGRYTAPSGAVETNPVTVYRPLASLQAPAGEGLAVDVDAASRALFNADSAFTGATQAQNVGAWNKPMAGGKVGESRSLMGRIPEKRPLTPEEMQSLADASRGYGLGDVVDNGNGNFLLTNWMEGGADLKKPQVLGLLGELPNGSRLERAKLNSDYVDLSGNFNKSNEGKGLVTQQMLEEIAKAPGYYKNINESTKLPQMLLEHAELDDAMSKKIGSPVRRDLQNLRRIMGRSPGRMLDATREALARGEYLPAGLGLLGGGLALGGWRSDEQGW